MWSLIKWILSKSKRESNPKISQEGSEEYNRQSENADRIMGWGHCDPPHRTTFSVMGNEVVDNEGDVTEYILGKCRVLGIHYDVRLKSGAWHVTLTKNCHVRRWNQEDVIVVSGWSEGFRTRQEVLSSCFERVIRHLCESRDRHNL